MSEWNFTITLCRVDGEPLQRDVDPILMVPQPDVSSLLIYLIEDRNTNRFANSVTWADNPFLHLAIYDSAGTWSRGPELSDSSRLETLFPSAPPVGRLHLVITTEAFRAKESPGGVFAFFRKYFLASSSSSRLPQLDEVMLHRRSLVSFLHDTALQHKIFLVRGSPGSGKSELATELEKYIKQHDEQARVTVTSSWTVDGVGVGDIVGSLEQKLFKSRLGGDDVDLRFKGPGKHWVLLDEAQSSYSDSAVQNTLLKIFHAHFIFVLFASHGSIRKPMDRDKDIGGTPNIFTPDKRMGLRPTMNGSEGSAIPGLYFTKEEYQRLLELPRASIPTLGPELENYIFEVTNGHVGAMKSIMSSVRVKSKSTGLNHLTLKDFFQAYETPELAIRSFCGGIAFGRGVPTADDIADPDNAEVVTFCKERLMGDIPLVRPLAELPPVALEAHKRGWVIREDEEPDGRLVRVEFSSPLHAARLSYLLTGPRTLSAEYASLSLRDFVIRVFSRFNGDNLQCPDRRINERGEISVPEAAYVHEFYRACNEMTGGGGLWLSPEFGTSQGRAGRVDFYVGSKRWGIEFLREGDDIEGHLARFNEEGAYYPWTVAGTIQEWVVVDCRMYSTPGKKLAVRNLLHVLFKMSQSGAGLVLHILDNELKLVRPPSSLKGGGTTRKALGQDT